MVLAGTRRNKIQCKHQKCHHHKLTSISLTYVYKKSFCMFKAQGKFYFGSLSNLSSSSLFYSGMEFFTGMPLIVTWMPQDIIFALQK